MMKRTMIPNLDIYRSANALIKQRGNDAPNQNILQKVIMLSVIIGVIVSGCQTSSTYTSKSTYTSSMPSNDINVENDPYKKFTKYTSEAAIFGLKYDRILWVLVGTKDRQTGSRNFYVQWVGAYRSNNWKYYVQASNNKAETLRFVVVDRDVVSCSGSFCIYNETFNIYFTEDQIHEGASSGLIFKVFAKDGTEKPTVVPGSLVQSMLLAMQ